MQKPIRATIAALILLTLLPSALTAASWQVFSETAGISGRVVNCFASFKTVMAVGTDQGVSIYSGNTGTWSTIALPEQIASAPIKDIAFDEHGHMWLATAGGLVSIQGKAVTIYDPSHNLPTIDIDRVQIKDNQIFIGCFGGYVARAYVPKTGSTRFTPVNYQDGPEAGGFKIKSVGISGLAMTDQNRGWFSTRGGGLIEIIGASQFPASASDGNPESWINDFYIFTGKSRELHTVAATPQYLSLIKNNNAQHEISLPMQDPWLNCVIAVKESDEIFDLLSKPEMSDSEQILFDFLSQRSLYVGTRNNGLWRFQKGKWTQFLTTNSSLPSDSINRLYTIGRLLVVCTDAGLVLIHLDSNQFDEFKKEGLGSAYFKTIFPFPPAYSAMILNFQIVKGSSYWFSHQYGLTRWRSGSFPKNYDQQTLADVSSRIEPVKEDTASDLSNEEPELPVDAVDEEALRGYWQLYTKEYLIYNDTELFKIPSQDITWMVMDHNTDYLWLIFDGKHLARMRIEKRIVKKDGRRKKIEVADWQMLDKYVPWTYGTQLNVVWYTPESIYVGTKGDGFYILKNPGSEDLKNTPFEWQHQSIYTGLPDSDVRGFAQWNSELGKMLAIQHNNSINLWDGEFYSKLELGGRRRYTCINSGAEGNLWIGSVGGLFRVNPSGLVFSYSSANAFFDSNIITAIGTLPQSTEYPLGIWVACDEKGGNNLTANLFEGSDVPPMVITDEQGKKHVIEEEVAGSSFHYFNGLTWDKWKIAGIRNIFIDNEFVWITTNIRVRRLHIPR